MSQALDIASLLGNAEAMAMAKDVVAKKPVTRKQTTNKPTAPKELEVIDGGVGMIGKVKVTVFETGCSKNWYLYETKKGKIVVDCASMMHRTIEGIPAVTELVEKLVDWEYERDNDFSRDFWLEREQNIMRNYQLDVHPIHLNPETSW